jgi:biotin carboxyl carrier protein
MKMEHRHVADGDGFVGKLTVETGQQVKNRQILVELELAEVEGESA